MEDERIVESMDRDESELLTRVRSCEDPNTGDAGFGLRWYGLSSTCKELMERSGRAGAFQWRFRKGRRDRRSEEIRGKRLKGSQ